MKEPGVRNSKLCPADETATVSWERKSLRSMDAAGRVTEESNQKLEGGGRKNQANR